MEQKNILIIGAGLVGSLLSIYLAKRGHIVKIYERNDDMRLEAVEAGRSINLALSDRGIKALQDVGIASEILEIAIPMHGRYIHNVNGKPSFQPYGKEGQFINSVSRSELNGKLMTMAEHLDIEIHFAKKCKSINWKTNDVLFEDMFSNVEEHVKADIIIGADGAYSASRLQHMLQHNQFDYEQFYIDCGYKEMAIPPGIGGKFLLDKNALHIWPRKDYMLIALPNLDGSFTGTLFFPFKGETSFEKLDTVEKVETFFQQEFPDVVKLIPDVAKQFFENPTSALVTVKCFPWVRDDQFLLIGDAAHAMVPFFGQGMNCGFEDCSVLNELLDKYEDDWKIALEEFQNLRKPDADAIQAMAINNFTEMRDKVGDPKFLLQKKIEAQLHEKFPDKWIPAYSQVTFSPQIRYSSALQRGNQQEEIMQHFMQQQGIEQRWNDDALHQEIISKYEERFGKKG